MTDHTTRLAGLWQSSRKIVFLGVGSPLRADDSVGLYVVEQLQKALAIPPDKEVHFFLGESAPENFSGEIRRICPDTLVIVDAANVGTEPGTAVVIDRHEIGGVSFSTHMLPLKILTDYLVTTTGCEVLVVGIQPKLLEFAYPISDEVKKAAQQIVKNWCDCVTDSTTKTSR